MIRPGLGPKQRRCWWREQLEPARYMNTTAGPNIATGRLPVATVLRIERLVGGDPVTEDQILRFIGARYGADNLLYLPRHVAAEICRRPADFIRAAKCYFEPELSF